MKKLKTLLLGLALVLSLSMFNAATVTTRAADPQGGGEGPRTPPCYPRCRPTAQPTSGDGSTAPAAPLATGDTTTNEADVLTTTLNEVLTLVLTRFGLFP